MPARFYGFETPPSVREELVRLRNTNQALRAKVARRDAKIERLYTQLRQRMVAR